MKRILGLMMVTWMVWQAEGAGSDWMTDLPKALEKAKGEKKLVLVDFTGSDWCPPCKALTKNVLTAPAFKTYAKEKLVLVELDFPLRKPQSPELKRANKELSEKFNVDGYPTVVLLDAEGKELGRYEGYSGENPKQFIAKLEKRFKD